MLTHRQYLLVIALWVGGFFHLLGQENQGLEVYIIDSTASRIDFERNVRFLADEVDKIEPTLPEVVETTWQWSKRNGDSLDILRVQFLRARHFFQMGLKGKSIGMLNAIRSSPSRTDSLNFSATLVLRDFYFELGAYDKAFELHKEIDWDQAGNYFQKHAPESFLAGLYLQIGDYEKSLEAYYTSMQKMADQNKPYWQMSFTNSRGVVFERIGMLDSALAHYLEARYVLENQIERGITMDTNRFDYILGLLLGNQAQILATQGLHNDAIPLFKKDIEASLNDAGRKEARINAVISLLKLTYSYLATGQPESAQTCVDQSLELIENTDPPSLWDALYKAQSDYYEYVGNDSSALDALQALVSLRDSIQSHQKLIQTQNVVIAYESIIKDKEKETQRKQIELLQRESKVQRETNVVFVILIIISLIIATAAIYRFNAKNRQQMAIQLKNEEIEDQKRTIQASLKEKEVLLREVNHRVKNNLQIVSSLLFLQSRNTKDPISKGLIKEAHQRVQTMSTIHQKLYQESQFNQVDFDKYIAELIQQTISSYRLHELNIATNIDIQYLDVKMDQAIPLSLIIHELVTNSMKHAFQDLSEGMIAVQLRREQDHLQLRYEDDGAGLDLEPEKTDTSNIGMKVIELLTQQINGSIHLVTRKPLIIQISFPID
ncbi:MAG: sensor histidine kinase [Cryomorphaceae bacterium]